jgi:hypothetical protein
MPAVPVQVVRGYGHRADADVGVGIAATWWAGIPRSADPQARGYSDGSPTGVELAQVENHLADAQPVWRSAAATVRGWYWTSPIPPPSGTRIDATNSANATISPP